MNLHHEGLIVIHNDFELSIFHDAWSSLQSVSRLYPSVLPCEPSPCWASIIFQRRHQPTPVEPSHSSPSSECLFYIITFIAIIKLFIFITITTIIIITNTAISIITIIKTKQQSNSHLLHQNACLVLRPSWFSSPMNNTFITVHSCQTKNTHIDKQTDRETDRQKGKHKKKKTST